ncbi:Reverse transcriptase (RNA-dependent DNA polymerase) [Popillia japonica]|uniref:Reverse transcriptase (RNA-dependent DNA polymerase) n=1 Tax=Popillia japonica TaxID=7064 RepID=A0AAW1JWC0_POPJA
MNPRLAKLIRSYLQGRIFSARQGKDLSSRRPIVAQGSLLAPTLFNIYMSNLSRTSSVEIAMYADDTALYTTSRGEDMVRRRLQRFLDEVLDWARSGTCT